MKNTANPKSNQMNLSSKGEWLLYGTVWSGEEVFLTAKRRSNEWLSDCSAERALTQNLMGRIACPSNLERACRHVIKNGGGPGVDGMTVKDLSNWFSSHYKELQISLLNGSYLPASTRVKHIRKAGGGYRQLGIPTVIDRLVQQAIHQELSPRYERIFSASSFGFRPGRGAHDALLQAGKYVSSGRSYVVDLDLAKFFDEVNHDRLLWLLHTRIGDSQVLKLIGRFLRAGLFEGGLTSQRIKGTPQGGPLSPLLSNIVLDELDKELERRCHSFVRYADDLIILVSSEDAGRRVLNSITDYIEKRLHLKVNREKSGLRRSNEVNFLGHRLLRTGDLGLSKRSADRFKAKVRAITRRNRGISFEQVVKELNTFIVGWLNYFYLCQMRHRLISLMSWLRRKLRCYRLKQCKRAIGIVRFLTKLGVPKARSWTTASSRKGWWRKSGTPAANEGMSQEWFGKIGLKDLISIYDVKHPKKPLYTRVRTVV